MSAKLMKFGYGRGGRRNRLLILNRARGRKFENPELDVLLRPKLGRLICVTEMKSNKKHEIESGNLKEN